MALVAAVAASDQAAASGSVLAASEMVVRASELVLAVLRHEAAAFELAAAVSGLAVEMSDLAAASDQAAAAAIDPVVAVFVGHFLLTVYNRFHHDQNRPMSVTGGLRDLFPLLHDLVFSRVVFLVYARDLAFALRRRCRDVLVASCSTNIQLFTNKKQKCPVEGCGTSTVHKSVLCCDVVTCAGPL